MNTKNKVYVVGGSLATLFAPYGYTKANSIEEADIIVWLGGADINPKIYNEAPIDHGVNWYNEARDLAELEAYSRCRADQTKVGICRGGQLLNCLSGGKLFQHVDNHFGTHPCTDARTGRKFDIISIHHQMMRLGPLGQLVAYAEDVAEIKQSMYLNINLKKSAKENKVSNIIQMQSMKDPEVVYYPHTRSLCFQSHPEAGHKDTTEYFFDLLSRYHSRAQGL